MHFNDPWLLLLIPLAVLPVIAGRKKAIPSFVFPSGELLSAVRPTTRTRLHSSLVVLRTAALVLLITALARPQQMIEESRIETEGIDIVLAVDTSTSMLAEDFRLHGKRVNRLEAVKDVVREFIGDRGNDRIGITAFAAGAYTVSPLTLDHGWLIQNLERIKTGMIEDGTAIGTGLGSSLNRIRETEAKSKVVILLTDGRNNTGRISPLTAAEAASALGIKVYTIGAGTKGPAPYPSKDLFGNTVYKPVRIEIDEKTLKQIAEKTGGKYFRATDTESLRLIYEEIDRLETTPIEEKGYVEFRELFHLFLIPGFFILLLEVVLKNSVFRRIP